jgi:Zn-dependent M28 family amino/carboxypeptidase
MLVSGHIDSVFEFKWWYRLGQWGSYLTIIAGAVMVLFPVFCLVALLLPYGAWSWWTFLVFVILSPSTVTYFNMHGNNPVDGAADNLTGIAIAFEVFKNFADTNSKGKSILKNTRLKFVSFGSEETGLSGSMNYVKEKVNELRKENAHIVNLDSIRVPEEVSIVQKEMMSGTTHSKLLIDLLQKSFASKNIPLKTGTIPIGGTDGVPFARAGIPSVSIIGIAMDKLDPTYHTRRDVVANLNQVALDNVKNGVTEFIKQWDTLSRLDC